HSPTARSDPSGLNATLRTPPSTRSRFRVNFPVATSHTYTSPQSPLSEWKHLPAAKTLPSGLNAPQQRELLCPFRVAFAFPVGTSQTVTVSFHPSSLLRVASNLLSGLNSAQ